MTDKPPEHLILAMFVLSLIVILIPIKSDKGLQTDWTDQHSQFLISQGAYLTATPIPFQVKGNVMASLLKIEDNRLFKIIECESNFRNVCNQKYGCHAGMGLGQLTRIAIKDCEKALKKKIHPFDPMENIECCNWLIEKYGTAPWGDSTTDWGSWACWSAE